ncbi:MAG TPA: CBS and ACT domain-containing protein [Methylomirabilota bacterium]|nr:CBS and ACT domain-containing protein [Methylomirabilota bacterium]
MLVQDIMQAEVITVTSGTTVSAVLQLLGRRGFRHVPVVDEGALVGIISDRDVKAALLSAATSAEGRQRDRLLERLTAGEIMSRPVMTIAPMFPVEEAARIMVVEKISALPVTANGQLVGIVTETDVLRLFVRTMGALEPSSRLDVLLDDEPAALSDVIQTIEHSGAHISSVVTLVGPGKGREAVVRVGTINPGAAVKALEAKGYTVRDSWRG